MTLKENIKSIFNALGMKPTKELTSKEWNAVSEAYQKKYGTSLLDDLASSENDDAGGSASDDAGGADNAPTSVISAEDVDRILGLLEISADSNDQGSQAGIADSVERIVSENRKIRQQLARLAAEAETDDAPIVSNGKPVAFSGPGTNDKYLFGIENPIYSLNYRWNKIFLNKGHAVLEPVNERRDAPVFYKTLTDYAASLEARYNYLHKNSMLDVEKLKAGAFTMTTTGLSAAGLGDQYVVRRQDALIARILSLRNVTDLFPLRSGVQDRELMTNAFFTSVSQAWQKGGVFKGSMELKPEIGYVDDSMAKLQFGTMEEIERMYIGYLNTDGSDAMKWNMIEFILLNIYKVMQNEQNKRRICGLYVKPDTGVAGNFLNAGTGVIYSLLRVFHEHKLLPMSDADLRTYTSSNMYSVVSDFVEAVIEALDDDQTIDGYELYLNANHKHWWIANIRDTFGKESDFTGPDSYANRTPDSNVKINWVPNMGKSKLILMQEPGNIQLLEFKPGEMLAMGMDVEMEEVKLWSRWKEGCAPSFVGKPFTSLATLTANNYSMQRIFMNKPYAPVTANATTIDVGDNFWFVTVENTQATALTALSNMVEGRGYVIECGHTTNATTIAKAANFAAITDNWTPVAVGDYIMLVKVAGGSIIELERCVNGVRSINTTYQPNVPGGR
jgi:hypothetical protein